MCLTGASLGSGLAGCVSRGTAATGFAGAVVWLNFRTTAKDNETTSRAAIPIAAARSFGFSQDARGPNGLISSSSTVGVGTFVTGSVGKTTGNVRLDSLADGALGIVSPGCRPSGFGVVGIATLSTDFRQSLTRGFFGALFGSVGAGGAAGICSRVNDVGVGAKIGSARVSTGCGAGVEATSGIAGGGGVAMGDSGMGGVVPG